MHVFTVLVDYVIGTGWIMDVCFKKEADILMIVIFKLDVPENMNDEPQQCF